jgi:uncharacterized protein
MTVWAIADLHLAFSTPDKDMAYFGPTWERYAAKIEENWRQCVASDDLVLLAGDLSWAMRPDKALIDLRWIDALPGTKVCIRGNHDYWWASLTKLRQLPLTSFHFVQHDCFNWRDVTISGTRLWDSPEYNFSTYVEVTVNPRETKRPLEEEKRDDRAIYERELGRLELALKALSPRAKIKIIMTHYPPIGADLAPSRASQLLEAYGVHYSIFGHLHNLRSSALLFGVRGGVHYVLTSADFLGFKPYHLF